MIDFFNAIGGMICHRLPSRSVTVSGRFLPVCARCTGIYVSAAVSVMIYFAVRRLRGNRPPATAEAVLTVLCLAPFLIDGAGSYAGLWASNNFLRILTGALAGFPIITLLILGLNYDARGENERDILKKPWEPFLFAGASICISFLVYAGLMNYISASLMIIFGIFAVFGGIIAVVAKSLWRAFHGKR